MFGKFSFKNKLFETLRRVSVLGSDTESVPTNNSKSCHQSPRTEYGRTLVCMRLYVNCAYSLGISPLKFDTGTIRLVHGNSAAHYARYVVALGIIIFIRFLTYASLAKDIAARNILWKDKFDILQLGITIVSFYCLGNHLHHFWKRKQIPETVNSFLHYYNHFKENTEMLSRPGQQIEHLLYNLFLISTFFNLWTIPIATTAYYVENCRGHFLSGIFPICERISPGIWRHTIDWSTPCHFIALCCIQFLLATEFISAVFVNVGSIYFLIFGLQQISKEMAHCKMSRRKWLATYKALKVLEGQINFCIGGFWMPFNLFGLMMITVAGTTIVIRVHPGLTMSMICGMLASVTFVTQFILTYFASNGVAASKAGLSLRRAGCRTKLETRALQTCKSIGINSGSFRILDRKAMLVVMLANLEYTVSILLAMKNP